MCLSVTSLGDNLNEERLMVALNPKKRGPVMIAAGNTAIRCYSDKVKDNSNVLSWPKEKFSML